MIIGQLSSDAPIGIAAWLGCAAFVLMLTNSLLKLADRVRGKEPEPPNNQLHSSLTDLSRRVKTLEDNYMSLREKMEKDKLEIIQDGHRRTQATHERINDILASVSELSGVVTHMNNDRRKG